MKTGRGINYALRVALIFSPPAFRTLILSGGFALLDSKSFHLAEGSLNPSFQGWIDSFKQNPLEICLYFFDEYQFKNSSYAHSLFLSLNEAERIYLIEHRKLLDIIQFATSWIAAERDFPLFNPAEYVLASSPRIFDLHSAKQLKE